MPKHPRKRQKTNQVRDLPLGEKVTNFHDDQQKDDEERRLEAILFGRKFVPLSDKGKGTGESASGQQDDEGSRGLQHLMDGDLFFVDDGLVNSIPQYDEELEVPEDSASVSDEDPDHEYDQEIDEPSSEGSRHDSSPSRPPTPKSKTQQVDDAFNKRRSAHKRPAWVDPADQPMVPGESYAVNEVSLTKAITRKLRDSASETSLSAAEYEKRLRRQWERINPVPEWANKARSALDDEVEGDIDISHLLNSTSGILARQDRRRRNVLLKQGSISIERLRDANQSVQNRDPDGAKSALGDVKVVAFHPNERIPLLCVGTSGDRRIRLFNIDGHTSPLLQTLHVPSLPITSATSAAFHPTGTHLLLTGPRPYFYTHDLQSGKTSRHARGLWGTTYALTNDNSTSLGRKRGRGADNGRAAGESMELSAFSPHTGDLLAVAGRGGYVHLVDWKSGSGQVLGSLKCGGGGGGVKGLWWTSQSPTSSSDPRSHLAVLSGDAEVFIWDVGQRKCVMRWKDDGGFRGAGRVLAGSSVRASNRYLAIGSNTGYVNVYDSSAYMPILGTETNSWGSTLSNPKPLKAIGNLTTPISTVRFNHDSQLMAISSKDKKDSMRLIHLPSLTAFSNWPTSSTPLGHVSAIDFSAQSEYLAIGNTRGRVLLYHLKGYGAGSV